MFDDTKFGSPSEPEYATVEADHGVHFRELGSASGARSFGHIRFTISLQHLGEAFT